MDTCRTEGKTLAIEIVDPVDFLWTFLLGGSLKLWKKGIPWTAWDEGEMEVLREKIQKKRDICNKNYLNDEIDGFSIF